jgi:hypothetical protein
MYKITVKSSGEMIAESSPAPLVVEVQVAISAADTLSTSWPWPSASKTRVNALMSRPYHVFLQEEARKTWMPGTRPGMTEERTLAN